MKRNASKQGTISVFKSPLLFFHCSLVQCVELDWKIVPAAFGIADKGSNQSRFTWELLVHFIDWAPQIFFCEGFLW